MGRESPQLRLRVTERAMLPPGPCLVVCDVGPEADGGLGARGALGGWAPAGLSEGAPTPLLVCPNRLRLDRADALLVNVAGPTRKAGSPQTGFVTEHAAGRVVLLFLGGWSLVDSAHLALQILRDVRELVAGSCTYS